VSVSLNAQEHTHFATSHMQPTARAGWRDVTVRHKPVIRGHEG